MLEILEKSLLNTLSIIEIIVVIAICLIIIGGAIYLPLGVAQINKNLKKIEKLLKDRQSDKISLD